MYLIVCFSAKFVMEHVLIVYTRPVNQKSAKSNCTEGVFNVSAFISFVKGTLERSNLDKLLKAKSQHVS